MNNQINNSFENAAAKLIWILLAVDAVLIVLHILFGWSVINLDEEGNLAAWYSSVKLLMLSVLCLRAHTREKTLRPSGRTAALWLLTGLIFLGLSADETASMHERLARFIMQESSVGLDISEGMLGGDAGKDSFAWVILLSPFIVAVTVFFAGFFHNRLKTCPAAWRCAAAGLLFFLLAIGMEATIYFFPSFSDWSSAHTDWYRFFIGFEEAGELFGATLFILAFSIYGRSILALPEKFQ